MGLWSRARAALKPKPGSSSSDKAEAGCEHSDVPHQPGTPKFELFLATEELKAGNLEHGAHHLAHLISYDPANPEWLALLNEYLRRANNDESKLWPIGNKRYFAQEAVRAYSWARKGKLEEALELLIQVVQAKPNPAYLDAWALDWLKQDTTTTVPGPLIELILAWRLNYFPEHRGLGRNGRRKLEGYAEIAERFAPGLCESSTFPMVRAGLLRKVGRFDEAIKIARAGAPDWHSQVAEGLALRERGDYEAAAAAFERALTFDSDDLAARLEAADGYLSNQIWEKAHDWYAQVLQREPDHEWALPSALFCRWKTSGDVLKHKRLVQMARRNPVNARAAELLEVNKPYVGILPRPADAIANICRSITRSFRENPPDDAGGDLTINVSHLESPSATMALEEQLKALGHPLRISVSVEHIPEPDPRIPCRPIKYMLWSYTGSDAKASLPSPPASVLSLVSELAANPYERDENWKDARIAARNLTEDQIPQLLAAMVNPPPVPTNFDALEWVPRVQLCAAQVVAHIGSGWQSSVRRDALLSVLFGPRDWITVAAIITLSHLAQENREIEADVQDAFKTLSEFIPDGGYCCFEHALFSCWQWLPSLTVEEKRGLQQRVADIEEE